jgi:hypothetical protein
MPPAAEEEPGDATGAALSRGRLDADGGGACKAQTVKKGDIMKTKTQTGKQD